MNKTIEQKFHDSLALPTRLITQKSHFFIDTVLGKACVGLIECGQQITHQRLIDYVTAQAEKNQDSTLQSTFQTTLAFLNQIHSD